MLAPLKNFVLTASFVLMSVGFASASEQHVLTGGTFVGLQGHTTQGAARIVTDHHRTFVEFGNDFKFDGAPDPKISIGTAGGHGTVIHSLRQNEGFQRYEIPTTIKITEETRIWLWCEQFAVPLGLVR